MPLTNSGMADAIKAQIIASVAKPPKSSDLDPFCNAIGTAIVTYLKANGLVIVPASSIVTAGSATTQTGPAAPVPLTIT